VGYISVAAIVVPEVRSLPFLTYKGGILCAIFCADLDSIAGQEWGTTVCPSFELQIVH
jgi:hypothetical protein